MKKSWKTMHVYSLKRDGNIDKNGRPAILLKYLGEECLIWNGTTNCSINTNEKALIIKFNNNETYFYSKGIEKVKTSFLFEGWKHLNTNKVLKLTKFQQERLIEKFSTFTQLENPYEKIKILQSNNEKLIIITKKLFELDQKQENKINSLQQENDFLKAQLDRSLKNN